MRLQTEYAFCQFCFQMVTVLFQDDQTTPPSSLFLSILGMARTVKPQTQSRKLLETRVPLLRVPAHITEGLPSITASAGGKSAKMCVRLE